MKFNISIMIIIHFFVIIMTKLSSSFGLYFPSVPSQPLPLESSTSVRKHWIRALDAILKRVMKTDAIV